MRQSRIGLRGLARTPGFTVVGILTLAVGIGATSSIYSVVHAALIRPLPFADPQELVLLGGLKRSEGLLEDWPLSYWDLNDLGASNGTLAELAAFTNPRSFNLLVEDEPQRLVGEMVSASYFRLLGIEPIQGRTFTAEEDTVGSGDRVAVVSYAVWRDKLGGDAAALERPLRLDGESFTIVGVMPPGFVGVTGEAETWVPLAQAAVLLSPHYLEDRSFRWLSALGRLESGVTMEQARSDLQTLAASLAREFPETNEDIGVAVTPLAEAWFGDLSIPLLVLLGAALFVLLIACVNLANLFLARSIARRRDMAIRSALGGRRLDVVQLVLAEGVLVALGGCAFALLLAHWSTWALLRTSAAEFKSFVHIGLDGGVILAALVVALVCGVCVGTIPAWLSSRSHLTEALKDGGEGSETGWASRRFHAALILTEVALTLVLLVGTGLMAKDFRRLLETDLGFRKEGLLTMRLDLKGREFADRESRRLAVVRLAERLEDVAGARIAIGGPGMPTDDWFGQQFTIEDRAGTIDEDRSLLLRHHVTPGYFEVLEAPLVAGRAFTAADNDTGMHVAIVSAEAARRYWPVGSPVGRRLKPGPRDSPNPWITVVGVAADIRQQGLSRDDRPAPDVYFSAFQYPPSSPPLVNLLARTEEAAAPSVVSAVREAVREVLPQVPVYDVATMEERLGRQAAQRRFLVLLMSLFGLLALGLSAMGIYGVISYVVYQSAGEIGLRMALGAHPRHILSLTVLRGARLVVAGIALGLLATLLLGRILRSVLVDVSSLDPLTLVGACLLLLAVGLGANYFPARRAMRVDPIIALRNE